MATATNTSAHTPSPWTFDERARHGEMCSRGFVGANGQGFAYTVGLGDPEDEANARLIAAAPQLLEALKEWVLAIELVATGSFCEVCRVHAPKDDDGHIIGKINHYGCPFDRARKAIAQAEGKS